MTLWHDSQGAGPELVLLHGWGMNAAVWEPLLPRLQQAFRVTRVELPGHGESPPVPGGLHAWAEDCLAVAPARAAWVGWSLGGLVALQAALLQPERVERLALVTATPSFVQRETWPQAMPLAVFDQFAAELNLDPAATLRRFLGLQVKGSEGARELLRILGSALAERPAARREGLEPGLEILLETDLRERLRDLQVPSQWLFGSRDTLVPVEVGMALQAELPAARVSLIEGAGHAPFLSHAEACLAWLRAEHG